MEIGGGVTEDVTKGLVMAYVTFSGCTSDYRKWLKSWETVRVEIVDEPREGFRFIHDVHGEVYHTKRDQRRLYSIIAELRDEGHLVLPDDTATVQCSGPFGEPTSSNFSLFIRIGFKRESAEMVSSRLSKEEPVTTHWCISYRDLPTMEDCVQRWKKRSKQFAVEASVSTDAGNCYALNDNVIKADLVLPHQKQAYSWMLLRETLPFESSPLPPFWEKCSNGMYKCLLTYFITDKRPQMIRGGIFADESGMGKTLPLLCLISHNISHLPLSKKRKADQMEDTVGDWKPTLVVCPPSVLASWVAQIEQFTLPGSLKVCVYRGAKCKIRDPDILSRHDLVLTTYNILVAEHQSNSPILNQIHWWRVILDDAHVLKRSTSCAAAPFVDLKATCRWAVTGKPVLMDYCNYDMFTIFAFLKVQQLCHKKYWERAVDALHATWRPGRLQLLFEVFSLRRTMPEMVIRDCLIPLSVYERKIYESMESAARSSRSADLSDAILKLWQSCNSLALFNLSCEEVISCANFQDLNHEPELLKKWVTVLLQEQKDYVCPICLDQPDNVVITRCKHLFCSRCMMQLFEKHKDMQMVSYCPMCRCQVSKHDIFCLQKGTCEVEKIKYLASKESSSDKKSTKVSLLLQYLKSSRDEGKNKKTVVISQFRRMLMLVDGVLSEAGFDVRSMCVIHDDSKTRVAKIAKEFKDAEDPVILLTTYDTLSNTPGLDLSAASFVYMMEPCWNPHTEEAALHGCIRRLGKKDELTVIRLVSELSIEHWLLKVRKRNTYPYGPTDSKMEFNMAGFKHCDLKKLLGYRDIRYVFK